MNGLEHAGALRIQIRAGRKAQAPLNHGPQIGDNISEHVGSDYDIKPLRVLDKPHGNGIHEVEVVFDLRIAFGNIQEDLAPKAIDIAEHIGLVHGSDVTGALCRQIKGIFYDPLSSPLC